MPSLADIRKQYPNAKDYSDEELIDYISSSSGIDANEVSKRFGYRNPKANDAFNSLKIGLRRVPGAVVGLGDVASGIAGQGRVFSAAADKLAEDTGFAPSKWAEANERKFSDKYYQNQAALEDARKNGGLLDEAAVFARNPSMVFNTALRSAPSMVAGGLAGLGLRAGVGAAAGAGIGEGAITAGSSMDGARGVDAERAAMASLGAGVGTGLLSAGGARVAKQFGLGDIDMLTTGTGSRGIAKRVGLGTLQEAAEEAPQSAQEQAWSNYANRRALGEGVGSAALEGGIVGGLTGGAFNVFARSQKAPIPDSQPSDLLSTATPSAPEQQRISGLLTNSNPAGGVVINFPDGSSGTQQQVDDYINSLPEPKRVQARAQLLGLSEPATQQVEQPAQEAAQPVAPQQNVWAYKDPDGVDIPPPDAVGVKGSKKVQLYQAAAEARQIGAIDNDELTEIANDIVQTTKFTSIEPRVRQALTDAKARLDVQGATPQETQNNLREAIRNEFGQLLSKKESVWFQARTDFANEEKSDAQLAAELGLKPQSITGYKTKMTARNFERLAKRYRLEPQQVKDLMFMRNAAPAEENFNPGGLPPSQQVSQLNNEEILDSMGTVKSVGSGQTGIGEIVENPDLGKVDPIQAKRAEEAAQARENLIEFALQSEYAAVAIEDWDDMKSPDAPAAVDLPRNAAAEWIITYGYWKNGTYTEQDLIDEQRDIENGLRQAVARPSPVNARLASGEPQSSGQGELAAIPSENVEDAGTSGEELQALIASQAQDQKLADRDSTTEVIDETEGVENVSDENANAEVVAEDDVRPNRNGQGSTRNILTKPARGRVRDTAATPAPSSRSNLPDGTTSGQPNAVDLVQLLTDLQAIAKYNKSKKAQANAYLADIKADKDVTAEAAAWVESIGERKSEAPKKGTTAEAITRALKQVTGKSYNPRIKILATAAEAVERKLLSSSGAGTTQAFVTKSGDAYFIAENIPAGKEMSVFLHEVGAHLGIEGLLTDREYNNLVNKIMDWSDGSGDKLENKIAKAALGRVESARVNDEDVKAELIAYFVEEAVNAGVNPSAIKYESAVGRWFATLMNALKRALNTLGIEPNRLTPQQVVDLAYGAANLELGLEEYTKPTKTMNSKLSIDQMPEQFQEPAYNIASVLKDKGGSALNLLRMTNDLVDSADKLGLKSAKKWANLLSAQQAVRNKLERELDNIISKADKLEVTDQEMVWETARDMSVTGKWGYVPTWRQDVTVDTDAAAKYNALNKEQRGLLDEIFKHGDETLNQTQKLLDATIDEEFDAKAKRYPNKFKEIEEDRAKYKKLYGRTLSKLEGPYVPLQGVGTHIVVGKSNAYLKAEAEGADLSELRKSKDDYIVIFTKSQMEADAERRRLAREGRLPLGNITAKPKREWLSQNDGLPFEAFRKLRNMAAARTTKLSENLNNLITELYITSLAETSARKSELRREGIVEMTPEAIRQAFVTRGRSSAHYISTLEKGGEIADAFADMDTEARNSPDPEVTKLTNEFAKRYANSVTYEPSPLIDALKYGNSAWMLLTKPAYYLYNLTQPFVMGMPMLAGKYSYGDAYSAMEKSYKELLNNKVDFKNFETLPKDVKAAMKELQLLGKLDFGMSQDLGSVSEMGSSKGARLFQTIERAMRGAAQKSESLNRIVMGMSAYRLAIANKESEADALAYAAKVIDESQGDYSGFNAPRLFNGSPLATLITQFRKFQVIQATYIVKNFYNAFAGATPQERRVARATFGFVMGHYAVLAGALGMPVANVIAFIYNSLDGDDDDEKYNLEADLRSALGNDMLADLITRGAPAALGLNMSDSTGAGNAFAILPYSDIDFSDRDGVNAVAAGLLGPTVSHAYAIQNAASAFGVGDYYRGLEALLPSGVRAASKSLREGMTGVENSKGDELMSPDEIEVFATTVKALGFKTQSDSVRQLVRGNQYEFEQFFKQRTSNIKRQFVDATKDGDTEEVADARRRWAELQEFKSGLGFKATPLSELLKARKASAEREDNTIDGVQFTDRNEGYIRANLSDDE